MKDGERRLPEAALARLGKEGGPGRLFTAGFGPDELSLVRAAGCEPVAVVTGTAVYHFGVAPVGLRGSQEMTALSQAVAQAWQAAVDRMLEEAQETGADGVIGVEVVRSRHDWGEGVADVLAQGTAVRVERGDLPRRHEGRPFSCLCGPAAFWALVEGGYRPLAAVSGHAVWSLGHQALGHALRIGHGQVELVGMTEGLYDARELALGRLQARAAALPGVNGVLGVRLVEEAHEWGPSLFEFRAEGTAVARFADREPPRPEWVVTAG